MMHPIELLNIWLTEEQMASAPNPRQAVLSTATDDGTPHAARCDRCRLCFLYLRFGCARSVRGKYFPFQNRR